MEKFSICPVFPKLDCWEDIAKNIFFSILFSVCVHIMVSVWIVVRGHNVYFSSLLRLCGFQEFKSDHQPWQQVPFKTHWLSWLTWFFKTKLKLEKINSKEIKSLYIASSTYLLFGIYESLSWMHAFDIIRMYLTWICLVLLLIQ